VALTAGCSLIPLKPNAARITDVSYFDPWKDKEGKWRPGKSASAIAYECFADFCEDLTDGLANRNVSTNDPAAAAAADRAERTLRTKQPEADPAIARAKAMIDAVKGGLPAFAPAVFAGDTRSKETCERVTCYAGDHDHETEESWAAAVGKLNAIGLAWFAYGSPKDGIDGVRRRLLLALSRDVTPKESKRLRAIVPALFGLTPDQSTVGDESRLFYLGTVDGALPYLDGAPSAAHTIDVDALLAAHPEETRESRAKERARASKFGAYVDQASRKCPAGVAPLEHARTLARSVPPAVQGESGHTTLFNLACDVVRGLGVAPPEALAILWAEFNPRCDPPWEPDERKDFDRKVSEAEHCDREPGYLLPEAGAVATVDPMRSSGAPASTHDPIFLRSRDGYVTLMFEGDELGHRPIADKIITTRVAEKCWDTTLVPLKDMKGREYRTDELLKEHGATYVHTAYAFANTRTRYDRTGEGRVVIGYPRSALPARFDADADAWLRALGGEHYERLAVWIASCDQQHINRLSACLILMGRADVGKSMFGHAVARMWGQTPPPLSLTVVQFNSDMLRCPILVDEEAQLFGSKTLGTKKFRDMVQAPSRSVERKGKERCELYGALRAVVSCNGISDLRFTDLGGPAVIEALRDRMLVIDATERAEACREPLIRLRVPGGYIVDLDRVAGHMAWLCANTGLPTERFIGAGGDVTQGAILAGHVEEYADLWQSLRDWIDGHGGGDVWSAHGGKLCVNAPRLAETIEGAGQRLNLRAVRAGLSPMHVGDLRPWNVPGRPRLWVLNADSVTESLQLDSDAREVLAERLNESPPVQSRTAGGRFGGFRG
jgi:hypothetical protein